MPSLKGWANWACGGRDWSPGITPNLPTRPMEGQLLNVDARRDGSRSADRFRSVVRDLPAVFVDVAFTHQ